MDTEPILCASAHERGRAFLERWRGRRPPFWCVLAHTDTCLLPGISSAGLTEELRPYTPAADAEVVRLGRPRCLPRLPSNPLGAPGPSGITRAALCLAQLEVRFVGAGLRVWPATRVLRAAERPGRSIEQSGPAVADARELFASGMQLGREAATDGAPYVVIGESVPGGTTTALAVLLALGYAAEGRVSGSMPGNAHLLKSQVAHAALDTAGMAAGDGRADPLQAVRLVGDPMQPLAAGMALGASMAGCDVLLAGGSQMVAVAALVRALGDDSALERVAIGTTRWVIADPAADVAGLAREIDPGLAVLAVNLDFSTSRHVGLHAYERFAVKEGVGAGGACIAALQATGESCARLLTVIDEVYDGLLGRLTPSDTADSGSR
ncbi:MAG: TIGR00303 family protein [Chloroflexi bacterium]|nr:TIGR00303 family protein [Chloroflexota bacterium]